MLKLSSLCHEQNKSVLDNTKISIVMTKTMLSNKTIKKKLHRKRNKKKNLNRGRCFRCFGCITYAD